MNNELILQIGGMLLTAGAIYGGIRAEIRGAHAKAEEAKKSADEAHLRLDRHLEKGG